MPKREDERYLNVSGRHPAYCTCTECTAEFLRRKRPNPANRLKERLFKREKVKRHPVGCTCATCQLLRSVGSLDEERRARGGFIKRLLGKR